MPVTQTPSIDSITDDSVIKKTLWWQEPALLQTDASYYRLDDSNVHLPPMPTSSVVVQERFDLNGYSRLVLAM